MVRFSSQTTILSLWLTFAVMCNLGICDLKVRCNEKDQQTLLYFKRRLTDPSNMLSTWSSEEDCCQWRGVLCDSKTGRVTNLNLPCYTDVSVHGIEDKTHCLTGELNLSLLKLEFLSYLSLSNNNFKALHMPSVQNHSLNHQNLSPVSPPHETGNSSNLVYLDLSKNQNLMIDDHRWLPRLSSLKHLNLGFIDLHKETQWLQILTMLPSLSKLILQSCQLESTNPSLDYGNFTSLKYLDISYNDFHSKLPNWLFNLSGLSHLYLCGNHLQGQLPNSLLNLENLNFLNLSDNMLSGTIPYWLGQLGSLQYLSLYKNLFTGPIPTTLGNLTSLRSLIVSSNYLNGSLPENLWQLSNLENLDVYYNPLTGVVSQRNFTKLSNLKRLSLSSPSLTFDFDPHWIPPFQLKELQLAYLVPKFPPWLYTQTSLVVLTIEHSTLALESQEKFWNWTSNIEFLSLYKNSMDWDMSNVLLNSRNIWMVSNSLRGFLPRLTPNVIIFQVADNSLSGSISPLLCHEMKRERNLQYLSISKNLLSGGLTDCWANWKSLVHVDLGGNNLTGTIPHSMGSLSKLMSLHLDWNNIYGEIPLSLQNCKKLMILNLHENKISGRLPNWMGQNLKALDLGSNQFSGDIPLQICQLSSLIVLDVANNRLSGTIPHCLHNITAMVFNNASVANTNFGFIATYENNPVIYAFRLKLHTKGNELTYENYMYLLDLSSNNLFGTIPSEIFRLTRLQSLNLSQNQLRGTVPEEIGNMKQLESLDLSRNKLSGKIPQSMSALSFLGFLNLSFNNFKGQIPSGTQLQSFTALTYIGNPKLCGSPVTKNCTQDEAPNNTKLMGEDGEESEALQWFYMGLGVGFAVSFWGVYASIFFNRTWRHAYFKFLDDMKDQLYVKVVLKCTPSVEI